MKRNFEADDDVLINASSTMSCALEKLQAIFTLAKYSTKKIFVSDLIGFVLNRLLIMTYPSFLEIIVI